LAEAEILIDLEKFFFSKISTPP
jgi:hypothetical protein